MNWFNFWGLIIVIVILLPNIVYAIWHKNGEVNIYNNKLANICEQISRYACMFFMIFNIPYTYFNFWFSNALIVYLIANGVLCLFYIFFWIFFWDKNGKFKALTLSIIPSILFMFSGIVIANIPLITFALILSVSHILISLKTV